MEESCNLQYQPSHALQLRLYGLADWRLIVNRDECLVGTRSVGMVIHAGIVTYSSEGWT